MKKLNGFTSTGQGPVVNDVRIEYSCGKEGYQEITAAYSKRRQGYGKPKHSWKSLLRVMGYLGPDKWLFVLVTFITGTRRPLMSKPLPSPASSSAR